jgi:hypothetical protein
MSKPRICYGLEVLEEVVRVSGYYDTAIFEGFDATVKEGMTVLVGEEIRVSENCKSIDAVEIVQPCLRLCHLHFSGRPCTNLLNTCNKVFYPS